MVASFCKLEPEKERCLLQSRQNSICGRSKISKDEIEAKLKFRSASGDNSMLGLIFVFLF